MQVSLAVISRVGWIVILVALAVFYLRYFEWKNVYYPARELTALPSDFGLEFDDVAFVAEDGVALHGWWIPCPDARGTLIYCHGNAGNIGDRAMLMGDLQRLGLNIFIFDYRGYGRSRGLPTEKGTYRDARAAYEVVRARYADADRPPIIVYGHSLGGAVAIQLALDKPVKGLMVESTFSSTVDMGRILYPMLPVSWLVWYKYDSLSKVRKMGMPKLFSHGRHDQTVPYELGRRLYEAAAQPKQFMELRGDHNEVSWQVTPEYWKALERFVTGVLGPQP